MMKVFEDRRKDHKQNPKHNFILNEFIVGSVTDSSGIMAINENLRSSVFFGKW
jgi:hypothetical protein